MEGITFLDHTADVKYVVKGESLEDCFSKAGIGLYMVMCDLKKLKEDKELSFEVKSKSLESLLYDFLSELIFFVDTENFLGKKVNALNIKKEDDYYLLNVKLLGQEIKDITDLEVYSYVKSATYSDMKIDKDKNEITIVLDI
ncbi:MAG: archease [Candidatus Woesearchaeota archaeon]